MNAQKTLFEKLLNILLSKAVMLESIRGYLSFDQQTICPANAKEGMGGLVTFASGEAHKAFVSSEIGECLKALNEDTSELSNLERWIVERLTLAYNRAKALPSDFVEKEGKILSAANLAWADAREKNKSSIFMPHFKNALELMKERAVLYGADSADPSSLYTTLLAGYEPGTSADRVSDLVKQVIEFAVPFLQKIQGSGVTLSDAPLRGHFDIDKQQLLANGLTAKMGYNSNRGHIALTTHPFATSLSADDHRITMRMNPEFLSSCIFAIMHEAGHALYMQNTNPMMDKINTSGLLYSLGLHESSSRLWENMVGRSLPFLKNVYPTIQTLFPQLNSVSLDEFYKATNVIQPSHIRVEADEVTYMLHIALRFEMEQAIIKGEIEPEDVPAEWDSRFEKYFGMKVDKPSNGWLQDVHWSYGYFGYFPTYLLGNLAAAQNWSHFRADTPEWEQSFSTGDFGGLLEWLKPRLYENGYVKSLDEGMLDSTGEKLDPEYWFKYINQKFSGLYNLDN